MIEFQAGSHQMHTEAAVTGGVLGSSPGFRLGLAHHFVDRVFHLEARTTSPES